jgi:hypothetical protein
MSASRRCSKCAHGWRVNDASMNYVVVSALHVEHEQFARLWDRNLRAQGFPEAFAETSIRG